MQLIKNLFTSTYCFVEQNKRKVLILFFILSISAFTVIPFLSFNNDMSLMLPKSKGVTKAFTFLREAGLSDKIVISFSLISDKHSQNDLFTEVDKFITNLKSPYILNIKNGINDSKQLDFIDILNYAPYLYQDNNFIQLNEGIKTENIKKSFAKSWRNLIGPGGSFTKGMLINDPIAIKTPVLKNFTDLLSNTGCVVKIEDGRFVSEDGKSTMIILNVSKNITDAVCAREITATINKNIDKLPAYVRADAIAGHFHTAGNEKVVKKDISFAVIISSIIFFILFAVAFRDRYSICIFLIPLISVALGMVCASMIIGPLSYFIAGMGGVAAGISIDYTLHIYAVSAISTTQENKFNKIFNVAGPVIAGAFTTIGIFSSFLFSKTEGYRQLAVFCSITILLCLFISLFILPHIVKASTKKQKYMFDFFLKTTSTKKLYAIIGLWNVCILLAILSIIGISFHSDIKSLDGSPKEVFQAEENFKKIWKTAEDAILTVEGKTEEEAFEKLEKIAYLLNTETNIKYKSILNIRPSMRTAQNRLNKWKTFWAPVHILSLKSQINALALKYNIKQKTFNNFFNKFTAVPPYKNIIENEFYNQFKGRFFGKFKNNRAYVSLFFDDTKNNNEIVSDLIKDNDNAYIVSRKSITNALSENIKKETVYFVIFAIIIIPFLTMLFLRSISKSIFAMLPVFCGLLASTAMLKLSGAGLNAPAIIAGLVVIGLNIDYGIFAVYIALGKLDSEAKRALFLSAATTIAGAFGLLFASHPILKTVGITLATGVFVGYITAIFALPALLKLLKNK